VISNEYFDKLGGLQGVVWMLKEKDSNNKWKYNPHTDPKNTAVQMRFSRNFYPCSGIKQVESIEFNEALRRDLITNNYNDEKIETLCKNLQNNCV